MRNSGNPHFPGAGTSNIANRLLGEERFRISEVRMWDSRERHTTVLRELILLPHTGALIDMPGMRELQLWAGTVSVDAMADPLAALERKRKWEAIHKPARAINQSR